MSEVSRPETSALPVLGINLLWLRPGQVGGSETMAVSALAAMAKLGDDLGVSVVLFVNGATIDDYPWLASSFQHEVAPALAKFRVRRVALESMWLRRSARSKGVTAMLHLGGTLPFVYDRSMRQTVLIHDLQPVELSGNFGLVKRWFMRVALRWTVSHADRIIVPSKWVRRSVMTQYRLAGERVARVYHGGPDEAEVNGPEEPVAELAGVKFLLFPAAHWKHKGHLPLIEAMVELDDLHLVLAGRTTDGHTPAITARISALGIGERVHVLGRITAERLRWLYRHAEAVIFPSEYEGFGLPVLEAAAYGRAPLASDLDVLDEFLPEDVPRLALADRASWPASVRAVLSDPASSSRMAAEIREKNRALTWETTVRGWVRESTER